MRSTEQVEALMYQNNSLYNFYNELRTSLVFLFAGSFDTTVFNLEFLSL